MFRTNALFILVILLISSCSNDPTSKVTNNSRILLESSICASWKKIETISEKEMYQNIMRVFASKKDLFLEEKGFKTFEIPLQNLESCKETLAFECQSFFEQQLVSIEFYTPEFSEDEKGTVCKNMPPLELCSFEEERAYNQFIKTYLDYHIDVANSQNNTTIKYLLDQNNTDQNKIKQYKKRASQLLLKIEDKKKLALESKKSIDNNFPDMNCLRGKGSYFPGRFALPEVSNFFEKAHLSTNRLNLFWASFEEGKQEKVIEKISELLN